MMSLLFCNANSSVRFSVRAMGGVCCPHDAVAATLDKSAAIAVRWNRRIFILRKILTPKLFVTQRLDRLQA